MLFKRNVSGVKKTYETRTSKGSVEDLKDYYDETARKAYYVYERSNGEQQSFLNRVLSPYINIEKEYEVETCPDWDNPDEREIFSRVTSFNPPTDIVSKVDNLYLEMVKRNLPTNAERNQSANQREIDEGFNNFFK